MASHIAKTAQQQVLERLAAHRASAGAGAGAGVGAGVSASSGGLGRGGVARSTNGATMAAAAGAANHNMSSHVTWQHIKRVQHLIERCLQSHMTQTEVVSRLADAHIQPNLTLLVWQKLEEQNPSFFYNYYIRLRLKEQIVAFNQLIEQQVEVINRMGGTQPNSLLSPARRVQAGLQSLTNVTVARMASSMGSAMHQPAARPASASATLDRKRRMQELYSPGAAAGSESPLGGKGGSKKKQKKKGGGARKRGGTPRSLLPHEHLQQFATRQQIAAAHAKDVVAENHAGAMHHILSMSTTTASDASRLHQAPAAAAAGGVGHSLTPQATQPTQHNTTPSQTKRKKKKGANLSVTTADLLMPSRPPSAGRTTAGAASGGAAVAAHGTGGAGVAGDGVGVGDTSGASVVSGGSAGFGAGFHAIASPHSTGGGGPIGGLPAASSSAASSKSGLSPHPSDVDNYFMLSPLSIDPDETFFAELFSPSPVSNADAQVFTFDPE